MKRYILAREVQWVGIKVLPEIKVMSYRERIATTELPILEEKEKGKLYNFHDSKSF